MANFCKPRKQAIQLGIIILLIVSLLSGCSWLNDLNQRLIDDREEDWRIAALEDFPKRLKLKKVWSQSIGNAKDSILRRDLLVQGSAVFGCSPDGDMFAFSAKDGKRLWHSEFDTETSFCVGGSGKVLMIGTVAGEVIALSAKSGNELWRIRLRGGAITAISKMHHDNVLVRSANGNISALLAHDGKRRWQIQEELPSLTLRGMSVPVFHDDKALVGLDDGRVIVLALEDGRTLREIRVGLVKQGGDLERIVDIDGKIDSHGETFYVSSYQGRTIAFDLERNSVLWFAEVSSYQGLTVGGDYVYLVNSNGELMKLDRYLGSEVWKNTVFAVRDLTAPLVLNKFIVVGDNEGYLYWVDAEESFILARFNARDKIVSTPVRFENQVIAVDRDGDLFAVKITARLVPVKG